MHITFCDENVLNLLSTTLVIQDRCETLANKMGEGDGETGINFHSWESWLGLNLAKTNVFWKEIRRRFLYLASDESNAVA